MPTITDIAICVRHWDFSETSQTVCLFGRDHGMIRGLAKGSKRAKGRFSGGIDLLTRGQIVAIVKPTRDLATFTEWDLLEVYWPLRRRLDAHRTGLLFGDLIHRMVTDHDPHPPLFDAFAHALAQLADPESVDEATMRFLWVLLRETGYQPQVHHDTETGDPLPAPARTVAFSPRAGGVVADTGQADRWRVRGETIQLLRALEAGETDAPPASGQAIARATRLLAAYIRDILGEEPPTMRWLFPDLHEDPAQPHRTKR